MKSAFSEIYDALDRTDQLMDLTRVTPEVSRVFDLVEEFEKELPKEYLARFQEIISLESDVAIQQSKKHYIAGMRIGIRMMLDIMLEREQQEAAMDRQK